MEHWMLLDAVELQDDTGDGIISLEWDFFLLMYHGWCTHWRRMLSVTQPPQKMTIIKDLLPSGCWEEPGGDLLSWMVSGIIVLTF